MAQGRVEFRVKSILTPQIYDNLKQALKNFDRTKDFNKELGGFFREYYDPDPNKKIDDYDRFYIPIDLLFQEKDYTSVLLLYTLLREKELAVDELNRVKLTTYKNYTSLDPLKDEKEASLFIAMSGFMLFNEKSTNDYFTKLSLLVQEKFSTKNDISIYFDLNNYLKPELHQTLTEYLFLKTPILKSFKESNLSFMWYSFAYARVISLNNVELLSDFSRSLEIFLKSENETMFNVLISYLSAAYGVDDSQIDKALLHCFTLIRNDIKSYYKNLLCLQKTIFEKEENQFPLAKQFLLTDIEIARFKFLLDPKNYSNDVTDFSDYICIKALFSETLTDDYSVFRDTLMLKVSDSKKTYIDIMFENVDIYDQALSDWYNNLVNLNKDQDFFEKDKFFLSVKNITTQHFLRFQYDKDKSNALMLTMSQFVDFTPELKAAFFAELENVFAAENHDNIELMKKHCLEISAHLSQHLITEFVSTLAPEAAKKLAELFAGMKCVSVSNSVLMKKLNNDYSAKLVFETTAKVDPFAKTLWNNYAASIEMQYLTSQLDISRPLNELVAYTRSLHRFHPSSERSKAGAAKYDNLVKFLQNLSAVEGDDYEERLEAAKVLLEDILNTKPKDSDLLKNRGGFFGAYKTYSRCMNAVGFKHFSFKHGDAFRTAESTTDHLLMTIYDEICAKTKKVTQEEDPEHSDYSSVSA